ncbi:MAG: CheR family methyltransferase, partial [Candidatus Methylomirabilales bacterium]
MAVAEDGRDLQALLDHLRASRGLDFAGFNLTMVARGVRRRMLEAGVERFRDYRKLLEEFPDEAARLSHCIFLNVTSFFRDGSAWDFLAREVVPRMIEGAAPGRSIRIWSAGCASGEEPYSVAVLMAEALGLRGLCEKVRIYGTDIDEESLAQARRGRYDYQELKGVQSRWRRLYFDRVGGEYEIRAELALAIEFGRHDLASEEPIRDVDLVICRHTLMYFEAEIE